MNPEARERNETAAHRERIEYRLRIISWQLTGIGGLLALVLLRLIGGVS